MLSITLVVLFFVGVNSQSNAQCPFSEADKCKEWLLNLRLTQLEFQISDLQKVKNELSSTKNELATTKSDLKHTRDTLNKFLSERTPWQIKRTNIVLPGLANLKLHQVMPTIDSKLPLPMPKNTRAILVRLWVRFYNPDGYAYLAGNIQQKGKQDAVDSVVTFHHKHWKVHANTWSEDLLVPWDVDGMNELRVKITESHNTGGDNNTYDFFIVGFIVAS